MSAQEPTQATLASDYPRWHTWLGVNNLWYAWLQRSSPAVVLRGETLGEIRDLIQGWLAEH